MPSARLYLASVPRMSSGTRRAPVASASSRPVARNLAHRGLTYRAEERRSRFARLVELELSKRLALDQDVAHGPDDALLRRHDDLGHHVARAHVGVEPRAERRVVGHRCQHCPKDSLEPLGWAALRRGRLGDRLGASLHLLLSRKPTMSSLPEK